MAAPARVPSTYTTTINVDSSPPGRPTEGTLLLPGGAHEDATSAAHPKEGCGGILYFSVLGVVVLSGVAALCANLMEGGSGKTPIETDRGYPFMTTAHPQRPTALWGDIKSPYPTGAWFLNLALGNGDNPVVPLPYAVTTTSAGVAVSYSAVRRRVASKRIQDVFEADLTVTAAERYEEHSLTRYDNLSVTVTHSLQGGVSFDTYLMRGDPYMTFEYTDATPTIRSTAQFLKVNDQAVSKKLQTRGTIFKVFLSNWETWLVYTSETVSMTITPDRMQASVPFSGMLRVAALPHGWDKSTEGILNEHAYAYARGVSMDVDVRGDEMTLRYTFDKHGFGDLLVMALPHHMDTMDLSKSSLTMQDSYQTMKGRMTGVLGSTWVMKDRLTTTTWTPDRRLDSASFTQREAIRKSLHEEVNVEHPSAPDPYGFGKQCGRMARLALIAHEFGDYVITMRAASIVAEAMSEWLRNDNHDLLIYDKTWGGVVTYNGLNDVNADFGNAWYNDHHFHYGYFLYAAAVANRFIPDFYTTHQRALDWIAADIVNFGTELSDRFPIARHKDWYDGHSWASGLFPQGNGKSQESVSEAVNAYYGAYLFGLSIGDKDLADWSRVLLAMEIRAAKAYWQMPHGSEVYDPVFAANRMVGVVAAAEAVQLTWFGDKVEWVHGINMLPFTPITEELLSYEFMEQEWPILARCFQRPGDAPGPQWAGYVYLAKAIVKPKEAWDDIMALDIWDAGNSKTNSLYWVATRENHGYYNSSAHQWPVKVDASCQDNSACFAQGLTELCCPTVEGGWLSCCPSYTEEPLAVAACSANPSCVDVGLTDGPCCPTLTGQYMDCCPQEHPEPDTSSPAACINNPGCTELLGMCCPTANGMHLGCCDSGAPADDTNSTSPLTESETTTPQNQTDAACAAHPACSVLEGDCCPTAAGDQLLCCNE